MIYSNLNQNYNAINTLDAELAGINEPSAETNLNQFISNISGVTDKRALFGLYDQFTSELDPSQHEQFFNAMEAQLGMGDLGPAYMEFKGFARGGATTTTIPDIEIDSALRSLEQGFTPPENIDVMPVVKSASILPVIENSALIMPLPSPTSISLASIA